MLLAELNFLKISTDGLPGGLTPGEKRRSPREREKPQSCRSLSTGVCGGDLALQKGRSQPLSVSPGTGQQDAGGLHEAPDHMGEDEALPPFRASTNGVFPAVLTPLPLDVLFPILLLPFRLGL